MAVRLVLTKKLHVVLGPLRRTRFRFPPAWADALARFNRVAERDSEHDRLLYLRRLRAVGRAR